MDQPESEPTPEQIVAAFARLRARQLIATVVTLPFFADHLISTSTADEETLASRGSYNLVILAAAVTASIAFTRWNWRCPRCKRYLGKSRNAARPPAAQLSAATEVHPPTRATLRAILSLPRSPLAAPLLCFALACAGCGSSDECALFTSATPGGAGSTA